jgi:hypothetical protein
MLEGIEGHATLLVRGRIAEPPRDEAVGRFVKCDGHDQRNGHDQYALDVGQGFEHPACYAMGAMSAASRSAAAAASKRFGARRDPSAAR